MDEHVERHEKHKQPVLRVGQMDRKRVSGRAQVDQAGPVDVVIGAQPHLVLRGLFEDQLDQIVTDEEQRRRARDER
jgi:hypothetical protein